MRFPESTLSQLACPECGKLFAADEVQTFCQACRGPLFPRYDISAARITLTREALSARPRDLWRWGELLPVRAPAFRLTLGEGGTPLLHARTLGQTLGMPELYIKDESSNPTGSAAARGMGVAVSRALELGLRELSVATTTGGSGEALAAYAARGRVRAQVRPPAETPAASQTASRLLGAALKAEGAAPGGFDLSAFQEPYRCEGHKTLGFELAEALGWSLPEVIVVPTGQGLNLVGLWKAFSELEEVGLIGSARPRLVSVQLSSAPFAGRLILRTLHESQGTALTVTEPELWTAQQDLARTEGVLAAPAGGAALAALRSLLAGGWLTKEARVVLINPAAGLKTLGLGHPQKVL
jgi:threonine synthase